MNSRLQPKLRVPPAPRAGSVSHSITIGKPHSDSDSDVIPPKPPRQSIASFRFKEDPEVTSTFLYSSSSADESDKSEGWSNENTLSNQIVHFLTPVISVDFDNEPISEHSDCTPSFYDGSEHSDRTPSLYENIESLSLSHSRGDSSVPGVKDDTLDLEAYLFDSDGETKLDTMPKPSKPLSDSDSDDQNVVGITRTDQLKPPPKPFRPSSISVNDILEYQDPSAFFTAPLVTPNLSLEVVEDPVYDLVHVEAKPKKNVNLGETALSDSFVRKRRSRIVASGGDPLTAITRPISMMILDKKEEPESFFQRSQSFGSSPISPQSSTRPHATPNEPGLFTKLFGPAVESLNPKSCSKFYLLDNLSVEETGHDSARKISDTVNRYKQAIVDSLTPAVFSIPQPSKSTFFVDTDQEDAIYHGDPTLDNTNISSEDIYYGDSTLDLRHDQLSANHSVSEPLRDGERIYDTPGTSVKEEKDHPGLEKEQSGYYSIADCDKPRWGPFASVSGPSGRGAAPTRPTCTPPSKPITTSLPPTPPNRPSAPRNRPTAPKRPSYSPSPELEQHTAPKPSYSPSPEQNNTALKPSYSPSPELEQHNPVHCKLSRLSVSGRPQNRQNRVISMAFEEDEIIPISDFSQTEYVNIQDISLK